MNKARLHHREQITTDMTTFWFSPNRPIGFVAGQFIELRLNRPNLPEAHKKRWFTLSSSPTEELVAITTRLVSGLSEFKRALDSLELGEEVLISEPMGDFVLPRDTSRPLLFVVGGIGITPVRSMLTYLQDSGEKRVVHILYAVADDSDIAYGLLLQTATTCAIFSSEKNNRLTIDKIRHKLGTLNDPVVYVSGPERMTEVLVKDLQTIIDSRNLVTDYFPGYEAF